MIPTKFFRFALLAIVLLTGIILIGRRSNLTTEDPTRNDVIGMMAPAGNPQESSGQTISNAPVLPTAVDISKIEPNQYDPSNQYDRWLRGEIDLDENASLYTEAEQAAQLEEALNLPPDDDIDIASPYGRAPSPGTSFASLDYSDCCGGGGSVPPDPELAVGPNHVIAVVNVALEIYDKTGASLIGPITFTSFMASDPNCDSGDFDPNALYDEEHDRYMVAIDGDGGFYCIAVSQTNDPTGSWHIYSFATTTPSANFFDYPHAGIGDDAIYMGANLFNCAGFCSFVEARVWAFDKIDMYAGSAASSVTAAVTTITTPQPLNLHGFDQGTWPSTNTHYFAGNENDDTIRLLSWTNALSGGSPVSLASHNLQTITGVTSSAPTSFPQSGAGGDLQGNDSRLQDFEYRNGYGWITQAIGCNPGSGTVNCVRWAQINLSTNTVADAGVYSSNGDFRSFPDLAVNHCNDMAVGYTKSNNAIFPSIWVTGRESGDSAGTLQAEVQMKAGEVSYTSFEASAPRRWGDYTEMTIAPDGLTFWYLGEYSKDLSGSGTKWGTYIGAYTFAGCSTPTATPTATNTSIAPTATNTPLPPTATSTPLAPTATSTAPPPTATTPATPTATATPVIIYDNFIYLPIIRGAD